MAKRQKKKARGEGSQAHWNTLLGDEFDKESDRARVILAAALLEQVLETLLRARLVPNPSLTDSLFDGPNAPASTFAAKIDLSYRVGLIPDHLAKELHLIRRIRNSFAHNVTGCDFSDSSVHSQVAELAKVQDVPGLTKGLRKGKGGGPRFDFQITCSWISWSLWALVEQTSAIAAAAPVAISSEMIEEIEAETKAGAATDPSK